MKALTMSARLLRTMARKSNLKFTEEAK
uniref:Cytochrome b n=1 Tax=Macrostomum lignano TaxID=282301 RepID=A0A1I8HDX3_9PLAT